LDFIEGKLQPIINYQICIDFERKHNKKFSLLTKTDKVTGIHDLQMKKEEAKRAINSVIFWGFSTVTGVISNTCVLMYTIVINQLYILFIILTCVFAFNFIFIQKKQMKKFFEFRKELNNETDRLKAIYTAYLPIFMKGYKSDKQMSDLQDVIEEKIKITNSHWVSIDMMNKIPCEVINVCFLIMLWNKDIALFLLVINLFTTVSTAIDNLFRFANEFHRLETKYTTYLDTWKNKSFVELAKQVDFPDQIKITNCYIRRDNLDVTIDGSFLPITMSSGMKICFKGPSGHGKSTFLDGLMGYLPGVEMSGVHPASLEKSWIYINQNMAQFYDFSKLRIRDLFENADDQVIIDWSKIFCIDHKVVQLGIDDPIQDRLSGGEKIRLIASSQMLRSDGMKGLIFDELEQGSDPKVAFQMMKNIKERFHDKIIIFVTHLQKTKKMGFDLNLRIKDGLIYRKTTGL